MRSAYLIAFFALASCDAVRLIQRDDAERVRVERYLLAKGLCRPDTVVIRRTDTLIRIDTVHDGIVRSDTTYLHDTIRIRQERLRELWRTITIRDTLWQTIFDRTREQSLVIELSDCRAENEAYRERQKAWRWASWAIGLLLLIVLVLAVRSLR